MHVDQSFFVGPQVKRVHVEGRRHRGALRVRDERLEVPSAELEPERPRVGGGVELHRLRLGQLSVRLEVGAVEQHLDALRGLPRGAPRPGLGFCLACACEAQLG